MLRCAAHAVRMPHGVTMISCVLMVLLLASTAAAQDCSKMYTSSGKPLLFGGLADRCVRNCQSRDSSW